jgi:hypothetical protein
MISFLYSFIERPPPTRTLSQFDLIAGIRSGTVDKLYWTHRNVVHVITCTDETRVRCPRASTGDVHYNNGILLKHFLLDGDPKNTDSFRVSKLTVP